MSWDWVAIQGYSFSMRSLSDRIWTALWQAFATTLLVALVGCVAFTFAVRNSQDGQAGMGAAFGGIYLGFWQASLYSSFR